jgi:hypothetical protein
VATHEKEALLARLEALRRFDTFEEEAVRRAASVEAAGRTIASARQKT